MSKKVDPDEGEDRGETKIGRRAIDQPPGWWEDAMDGIPFYSKRLGQEPTDSIDNIFMYQDGIITTEFVSGNLRNGTVQPPNSKLFEYIVMMYYLNKFELLNPEGLRFRKEQSPPDSFFQGDTLLPCLCGIQTTGYINNTALFDMDFRTFKNLTTGDQLTPRSRSVPPNCLGVDIKIKGIDNYVPNSRLDKIPNFDYADSIRAIDKLVSLIGRDEYFIQFLGFYQNTDKSIKQITLNQNGMFKFKIDRNFAIACIGSEPERHRDIWLQLLKNKFLFFNVKNEDLSTVDKMMDVWNDPPTDDSGLLILKDRLQGLADQYFRDVFTKIKEEIAALTSTPHLTVLDLLKEGVDQLNVLLPEDSLLQCRSNSTQRNPQVRLCFKKNPLLAKAFLIRWNGPEFPEISLPKTKRQLGRVAVKELKRLSYTKARRVLVKHLKDEFSDEVRMITNQWNEENPNIGARRATMAPVQYLFDRLLYYPYRRLLREGQPTNIGPETITRVINRRREQRRVRYTFDIPLLRKIKNVLKKEVRENPGVDTFGSLHNILQGVHLRYHNPEILRDLHSQQRPQSKLAESEADNTDIRMITRNKLLTDGKKQARNKESVYGNNDAWKQSLRQGGGGRNSLQITYKLIIPTLLLDLDDLLNIDLKNYNLEDYENHPIWSTIKNLYCFIDSVNNDNYQNFTMKKIYDFWYKSEEKEFIVNILDPFKKIVITYNKYINKYFDDILKPKTIQDKHTPKHKPILTPSPRRKQGGGGRRNHTRKKRRKKKKSRRKRRK